LRIPVTFCLLIWIAALAVTPAEARSCGREATHLLRTSRDLVKVWEQDPDTVEWGNFASSVRVSPAAWFRTADDFTLTTDDHIVAIEWWGRKRSSSTIDSVRVTIFENEPDTRYPVPGDTVVYQEHITAFTEVEINSTPPHHDSHYTADLPVPFVPEAGETYWLCVQPIIQDQQFWWMATVEDDYWGAEATFTSDFFGVYDWITVSEQSMVVDYMEMAFILWADDCTVVEGTTWGAIKAMYR